MIDSDDWPHLFLVVSGSADAGHIAPLQSAPTLVDLCSMLGQQTTMSDPGDEGTKLAVTLLRARATELDRPLAIASVTLPHSETGAFVQSITAALFELRLRATVVLTEAAASTTDTLKPLFFGSIVTTDDWRSPAKNQQRSPRLCPHIFLDVEEDQIRLHHVCTNETFGLPTRLQPALMNLADGSGEVDEEILEALSDLSLLHAHEMPRVAPSEFLLARARLMIEAARAEVIGYASLGSNELTDAPFVTAADISPRWRDFLRDDLRELAATKALASADLYTRRSSGSTGDGFLTLLENDAANERVHAETALTHKRDEKTVRLNRPSNLFDEAIHQKLAHDAFHAENQRESPHVHVTFGTNPTIANPESLRLAAQRIAEFAPVLLEGDPHYIVALTRFCAANAIAFPSLDRVEVGHGFLWGYQRKQIADALGIPVLARYHSSEAGTIASECREGALHLLESYAVYEIIAHGKNAAGNQLGAIAFSPLDSAVRPLVRYVLGDAVSVTGAGCRCGNPFRTIAFEGRLSQLFRNDDGTIVTQRTLNDALGSPPGLSWARFSMRGRGPLLLSVVADSSGDLDVTALRSRLEEQLRVETHIEHVTSLDARPKVVTLEHDALDETRAVNTFQEFFLPAASSKPSD